MYPPKVFYSTFGQSSNNLLLGSSITKSGLHRGPNTRYILYNDTIKIYKLELKPKTQIWRVETDLQHQHYSQVDDSLFSSFSVGYVV